MYPDDNSLVIRERFEVDFHRVSDHRGLLAAARLGYCVRHKSQIGSKREVASIWRYGVELEYLEDNLLKVSKLWLCKRCHLASVNNDTKRVDSTTFIIKHTKLAHGIDPATGLLPETLTQSVPRSPFEAAVTPGNSTTVAHSPWRKEELQAALFDWVIAQDVSFATATSTATRGLLTWQRSSLLHALPNSASTMSAYVRSSLEGRKVEIASLLQLASSKISISVDIWTSSNYMSFLRVVAHFAGKRPGSILARLSIKF